MTDNLEVVAIAIIKLQREIEKLETELAKYRLCTECEDILEIARYSDCALGTSTVYHYHGEGE